MSRYRIWPIVLILLVLAVAIFSSNLLNSKKNDKRGECQVGIFDDPNLNQNNEITNSTVNDNEYISIYWDFSGSITSSKRRIITALWKDFGRRELSDLTGVRRFKNYKLASKMTEINGSMDHLPGFGGQTNLPLASYNIAKSFIYDAEQRATFLISDMILDLPAKTKNDFLCGDYHVPQNRLTPSAFGSCYEQAWNNVEVDEKIPKLVSGAIRIQAKTKNNKEALFVLQGYLCFFCSQLLSLDFSWQFPDSQL